ncbi:MAG: hypothetical protein JWM78_1289 [Verrucomicrobiaceae bacterium]|nr:hypothetical protein [Verrucomicrobiaceae bacterium]
MSSENSANGTSEHVDKLADDIEAEVHSTTDAAAKIAHELIDRVARVARESEERIRQTASSAESSLQQTLSTARIKSSAAGDSVTDFVRQHPLAALSIAFGSGVLLSYLTRSNGRADRNDHAD